MTLSKLLTPSGPQFPIYYTDIMKRPWLKLSEKQTLRKVKIVGHLANAMAETPVPKDGNGLFLQGGECSDCQSPCNSVNPGERNLHRGKRRIPFSLLMHEDFVGLKEVL